MYLNLHLDPILYLIIGVGLGYIAGRVRTWTRRKKP